jgi:hypothetical protein
VGWVPQVDSILTNGGNLLALVLVKTSLLKSKLSSWFHAESVLSAVNIILTYLTAQ